MKTQLINQAWEMQLFYCFRIFSEQGDSLSLVSKGPPSRQKDDLSGGVKGKVPA